MRARQPHKAPPVLHTPGTELKQLPLTLHLHRGYTPRMRDEEQGMTTADLCAPVQMRGEGGVKVNTKRSKHLKEIQRTDELVSFTFSKLLVLVFLSQ